MSEDPTPYVAFRPSPVRFRVWDEEGMHYPDDDVATADAFYVLGRDGEVYDAAYGRMDEGVAEGAVPLLSTGLRDADGVEVWQGDEWEGPDGDVHQIADVAAFLAEIAFSDYAVSDGRVVGNVYQGRREPAAPAPDA